MIRLFVMLGIAIAKAAEAIAEAVKRNRPNKPEKHKSNLGTK